MSRVQIFAISTKNHSASKGGIKKYNLYGSGSKSIIVIEDNMVAQTWTLVPAGVTEERVFLQHADTKEWAFAPLKNEGQNVFTTPTEKLRSVWRIVEHDGIATIHLEVRDDLMWGIEEANNQAADIQVLLRTGEEDERNQWELR
ncbi:hypothetical protein BDY19DRAFT_905447 [Irpex rosettiformis]|uniref:Uncharacterized protein n=1 Tax=Irpex rosettiformis TaxID=378272 RepID=A0ACB8U7Y5_9APHY|nr:hypothetical protein BDY19DRAFT_905447 [Irpex rosettiformis]